MAVIGFPFKFVRFATHCDGVYINYPSTEIGKRWDSKDSMKQFNNKVGYDALKCSRVLMGIEEGFDNELTTEMFLVNCVGLEHLISFDVPEQYKAFKAARKEHVRLVLEEQKRQKDLGTCCPLMLSYVSSF